MTDDQQRARELRKQAAKILADAYNDAHFYGAMDDALSETPSPHCQVTITAITAALRAAPECPEGFLMVPEIATEAMLSAAYPRNERIDDDFDRQGAWADCLAARPQGVKDA